MKKKTTREDYGIRSGIRRGADSPVCPSRIYSIQDKHTNVSIFLFSDSGQRIGVGVGAKTGATPFFHAGAVLMMRLLYWLWLPPLFLGLYSKKNPIYQGF
jgi:hypothetical protein